MGHIKKRGNSYYAIWSVPGESRPRRRSCRTADRQVAKARLREWERAGTNTAPHKTPGLEQTLTYFVDVACAEKADGTRSMYEQKARHLVRVLGRDVPISSVTRDQVRDYIALRIQEGAASGTVGKELVTLRGALKEAQERGLYPSEPAAVIPSFKVKYTPRTRYLTREEFRRLLASLAPSRKKAADRRPWLVMSVFTGSRLSEVEGIRWEHIRWEGGGWVYIPGTKTGRAARLVPMAPDLRPWLEFHLPEDEGDRFGPVLKPWSNCRRDLARKCERLKIQPVTSNDLRRTFASWLKQEGVDSTVVAHLLGHTSTRMVEMVYGRLDQSNYVEAIQRLPQTVANLRFTPCHEDDTTGTYGTENNEPEKDETPEFGKESGVSGVPGLGIEPRTRGFSVPESGANSGVIPIRKKGKSAK